MTGGMPKYWIIPRVGDKELPYVGHLTGLLQSPHFLCSYVNFFENCLQQNPNLKNTQRQKRKNEMWEIKFNREEIKEMMKELNEKNGNRTRWSFRIHLKKECRQ